MAMVFIVLHLMAPSSQAADCNNNSIDDNCDIACGQTGGVCDVPGCGQSEDCNANGVLDECDLFDPVETVLTATDVSLYDHFGSGLAVSGDAAVLGAPWSDDNGLNSGSAYVFRLDGSNWTQEAKLVPSDGFQFDYFGEAVAIDGNVVVVGSKYDTHVATRAGSAYVFRENGGTWTQEKKLVASDASFIDYFGTAVAVHGGRILVGSLNDHAGTASGAAYVFDWNGANWIQKAKITASDAASYAYFSSAVALDNDVAVIGAYGDTSAGVNTGAAYVYRWNGAGWIEEAKLTAIDSAGYGFFGRTVSISDNVIVVGAHGFAFVFRKTGMTWAQEDRLVGSNTGPHDNFGAAVWLSGDRIIVGAPESDQAGSFSGSAYAYRWDGNNWLEYAWLAASDAAPYAQYGTSVAISGSTALVGAPLHDAPLIDAGTAYAYELGNSQDCNGNEMPDECDIEALLSQDCNGNGVPDECEPDCDSDNTPDQCEPDDDEDGVPNDCDVCPGYDDASDNDDDGRPDGCDVCYGEDPTGDDDGDGVCNDRDLCPNTIPGLVTIPDGCPPLVPGDFDRDGDIDADDVSFFVSCAQGSNIAMQAGCEKVDLDLDDDGDQADFGRLQRCLSGENLPADPYCAYF